MWTDPQLGTRVCMTRNLPASAERVFDAWLNPAKVGAFLFAGGTARSSVEIDARVGGHFRYIDDSAGVIRERRGEYYLIQRPRRLVFSCPLPGSGPAADLLTIHLVDLDRGCALAVLHELPPRSAHEVQRLEASWLQILERLAFEIALPESAWRPPLLEGQSAEG